MYNPIVGVSSMPRKRQEGTRPSTTIPYHAEQEHESNTIGRRIADARHKYKMSAATFSDYLKNFGLEVSAASINKWENGVYIPSAYQFLAVCCALNITDPLDYFTETYSPPLNAEGMKKVASYTDDLIASGRYRPDAPVMKLI